MKYVLFFDSMTGRKRTKLFIGLGIFFKVIQLSVINFEKGLIFPSPY